MKAEPAARVRLGRSFLHQLEKKNDDLLGCHIWIRWLSVSWEWRRAIKVKLRDSVNLEELQGSSGGSTPCPTNGSALTVPNVNISDCGQRVNEPSLEGYTEQSDMNMCLGRKPGHPVPLFRI